MTANASSGCNRGAFFAQSTPNPQIHVLMIELKVLSQKGIEAALEKAHRYRLLSEPMETESICRDVLQVDPENQQAVITLLLAITDQFGEGSTSNQARELLGKLKSEYDQWYYEGIIYERLGKAAIKRFSPPRMDDAYELLKEAMDRFENAEPLRPQGNDDAILRWNTCARVINRYKLSPRMGDEAEQQLE